MHEQPHLGQALPAIIASVSWHLVSFIYVVYLVCLMFNLFSHSSKQKNPHMLDDICLYSDLCESLSSCNYRLQARRFLQEIFLDVSFSEVCTPFKKIVYY